MDNKIKSYQDWMPVKAKINSAGRRLNYKEGDIYWVSIGENVGVFKRKSVAILTQLRAFDTLRISGKKLLGRVDKNTLKSIKNKLSKLAQS